MSEPSREMRTLAEHLVPVGEPDEGAGFREVIAGRLGDAIEELDLALVPRDGGELTFAEVIARSTSRRDRWHPPESEPWSGADWSNAMCGEAGEAANVVKKIRRHETGLAGTGIGVPPLDLLVEDLALELADVVLYLVLVAAHYDIDLPTAIAEKFNFVSYRQGFPERLPCDKPACSCGERGWVDDEGWGSVARGQRRRPYDGLLPCGFCNPDGDRTCTDG